MDAEQRDDWIKSWAQIARDLRSVARIGQGMISRGETDGHVIENAATAALSKLEADALNALHEEATCEGPLETNRWTWVALHYRQMWEVLDGEAD